MFKIKAKILYNNKIKNNYLHCLLDAPAIARDALPGQFVNIRVSNAPDPLLRRPLSIHRARGRTLEVLYEVVGIGTELLSKRKSGEYLDLIGPLGKGFNLTPKTKGLKNILVAGGMGVAPLLFLAERLAHSPQCPAVHRRPLVLVGAKTKKHLLCEKEFKDLGCEVRVSTDDGTKGYKGKITDLLKQILLTIDYGLSTIYACGPKPMSKEIAILSKRFKIPAQVSLEEHMACGIGACLGCTVTTADGYRLVCKDGPVFEAEKIIWE
jgi:dihydroorotate dehydrogenase electron transfer subunit